MAAPVPRVPKTSATFEARRAVVWRQAIDKPGPLAESLLQETLRGAPAAGRFRACHGESVHLAGLVLSKGAAQRSRPSWHCARDPALRVVWGSAEELPFMQVFRVYSCRVRAASFFWGEHLIIFLGEEFHPGVDQEAGIGELFFDALAFEQVADEFGFVGGHRRIRASMTKAVRVAKKIPARMRGMRQQATLVPLGE